MSERYLEQLMVPLKRAGLVKSVRGAQGGYILARNPQDITAGDIIRVLEGPIAPVECVSESNPEACSRADFCVTRSLWTKVRDSIAEVLDSYTLADLARQAQQMGSPIVFKLTTKPHKTRRMIHEIRISITALPLTRWSLSHGPY